MPRSSACNRPSRSHSSNWACRCGTSTRHSQRSKVWRACADVAMSTSTDLADPQAHTHTVPIAAEADLLRVRSVLRAEAREAGLNLTAATKLVTAGSELARNIFRYATHGQGV